jgi:hypothetical protein
MADNILLIWPLQPVAVIGDPQINGWIAVGSGHSWILHIALPHIHPFTNKPIPLVTHPSLIG